MKLRLILSLALTSALPLCQAATLDETAMNIALRNPSVMSARAGYEADLASARAENILAGPEVEGEYLFSSEGNDGNRWSVSVGQSFDWPGLYAARRRTNVFRAEAYSYLYKAELAQAAYDARLALIRWAAAEAEVKVIHTAHKNMDRMSEAVDRAFERGDVTILEVHKLRMERFATASRCAEAEAEAESARAAVKALNGGVLPELPHDILALSRPMPLGHYEAGFKEHNPSLAANSLLAKVAQSEIEVARRAALPSFSVAYTHAYEEATHFNGFSVGITLPSWSRKHSVAAAKARATAAQLDIEDYRLTTNTALIENYNKAVRLYERLSDAADTFGSDVYPELLMTALKSGKLDVVTYLTEYNQYLSAAADYQELCAEFASAVAYLTRYNIEL